MSLIMEQELEEYCCVTQLIDGNGVLNKEGLDKFTRVTQLSNCGLSYASVAIMGPQSSGKSTLLNHLFGTNFKEMDACRGRNQTTKGIWMAKCIGIEPFTIAMDLEGTDSRERGEDDTAFEKQSALFALAVADTVLINMWCHDIGRDHAANKPLLKTVFRTPLECLEPVLREYIQKIWDEVAKPDALKSTPLSEFFEVEVAALSSYEEKEYQFKEQVAQLRQRISESFSSGGHRFADDRQGVVPASGFSFSLQQIWKTVKENNDLDLPAHKVMVATVRCEEIANDNLKQLTTDEDLLALEESVKAGPISGFGEKVSSILKSYLSEYDKESIYFDDGVRNAKRQQLELNALDVVHDAYNAMLGHLRSKALGSFKITLKQSMTEGFGFAESVRTCKQSSISAFDEGCEDASVRHANWDASEVREKLGTDIEKLVSSISRSKLSELMTKIKKRLTDELTGPVESLLEAAGEDTWASLRKIVKLKTKDAVSEFSTAVASFELDRSKIDRMVQTLTKHARNVVERKAREEVGKVLLLMKDRFTRVFNHDNDSRLRVWTGQENIRTITKDAHCESLKILSVMAAIRLDKKPDNIKKVLSSLMDHETVANPSSIDRSKEATRDPLASSTWEEISPNDTLITPAQCKSLWGQFEAETKFIVTQAISSQAASSLRWRSFTWVPVAVDIALEVAGLAGVVFFGVNVNN